MENKLVTEIEEMLCQAGRSSS